MQAYFDQRKWVQAMHDMKILFESDNIKCKEKYPLL